MPIRPGPTELIIILVIVMMIFGAGKLPQVGSAIGKTLKEFRKSQSGDEIEEEVSRPAIKNGREQNAEGNA